MTTLNNGLKITSRIEVLKSGNGYLIKTTDTHKGVDFNEQMIAVTKEELHSLKMLLADF